MGGGVVWRENRHIRLGGQNDKKQTSKHEVWMTRFCFVFLRRSQVWGCCINFWGIVLPLIIGECGVWVKRGVWLVKKVKEGERRTR